MSPRQPAADPAAALPRRWLIPVSGLVLTAAFHLATAQAEGFELFRDELYFLACGQHLDFGYVDQPAFIALVAALSRLLFGASMLGLHLFPALAAGGTCALAALLARRLGGAPPSEVLAATSSALAPIHLANGGLLTMNTFDVLLWAAALLLAAELLDGGPQRRWLWFGLVAGVGLENKLSMGFLGAGLAVGLVLTARGRALLRSRWPWLGALLAVALALPYALWQWAHGWPMAELIAATARKNQPVSPWGFLGEQALHLGFTSVPLWLAGLWWLLRRPAGRPFRALGVAALVVLAILLSDRYAKPYYLAPLHVLLLAAGSVGVGEWLGARARPLLISWTVLTALLSLSLAPLAKPILSLDGYLSYSAALGLRPRSSERQAQGRLPQFYADRLGWRALAEQVAAVHQQLPAEERKQACIYADNYGEAAAIDFYGAELGLPPALSGHNNYWVWGPRGCSGQVVIVLAGDRAELDRSFEEVSERAVWSCGDCMPYENGKRLYVARRMRRPLVEVWPALRHII